MKLSRREFVKGSSAALFASSVSPRVSAILTQSASSSSSGLRSFGPIGLPKMTIQDFTKPFDPAYLSNGLIGIRPGPNPLAKANAYVSGFVFAHIPYAVESLSPAPYPFETDIRIKGVSLLKHFELLKIQRQTLDMASGELTTDMVFAPSNGITLDLQVLQFASRALPCVLCQEIRMHSLADAEIEVLVRINNEAIPGRVFMNSAPDRTNIDLVSGFESGGNLSKLGVALLISSPEGKIQKQEPLVTEKGVTRTYLLRVDSEQPVRFQTIAAMVSQLYHPEPALEAIRLVNWASVLQFEELRNQNREAWGDLWQSRVRVSGNTDAQRVLDAAFFYLHSSLHASTRTGMPPFGLSQFAYYYGHSFWDTESWSLLPITMATPATARSLLEYRLRGLDYAKRQADLYGYRGAQFPWEAAPTSGFETTPTFAATGWGEQHVTPDVALGFWEYQLATNDQAFLKEGTWHVLSAVAEWIESRGVHTNRGFEIQHIMGPDESVPNINNESYMNLVCKMALTAALRCAQMVGASAPSSWTKIRDAIVLPIDKANGLILPYDNPPISSSRAYSTGLIDLLTVHDPPIEIDLLRKTHDFEQAMLRGHSTALMPTSDEAIGFAQASVAATAAFLGEKQSASQLFDESWRKAWLEPFGMIREVSSQDYGCFLTNYGSLLQTAMLGFTGIRINEGDWRKYPASLPEGWSRIEIDRIWVKGEPRRLIAIDGAPAKLLAA
jgi:trehalose/maltose hydrolase-like predicted phosphorylase